MGNSQLPSLMHVERSASVWMITFCGVLTLNEMASFTMSDSLAPPKKISETNHPIIPCGICDEHLHSVTSSPLAKNVTLFECFGMNVFRLAFISLSMRTVFSGVFDSVVVADCVFEPLHESSLSAFDSNRCPLYPLLLNCWCCGGCCNA